MGRVHRDRTIEKNYRREINLQTKTVTSKKKYQRNTKHKKPLI